MAKARVFPKSSIPAGFTAVATGNFAPVHDFKKLPVLQGIVQQIKEVTTKLRRKAAATRIMTVVDEDGVLESVWESAALEGLFEEAKPGDGVYIKYTGPIRIKGRQQPMKGFECAIRKKEKAK